MRQSLLPTIEIGESDSQEEVEAHYYIMIHFILTICMLLVHSSIWLDRMNLGQFIQQYSAIKQPKPPIMS